MFSALKSIFPNHFGIDHPDLSSTIHRIHPCSVKHHTKNDIIASSCFVARKQLGISRTIRGGLETPYFLCMLPPSSPEGKYYYTGRLPSHLLFVCRSYKKKTIEEDGIILYKQTNLLLTLEGENFCMCHSFSLAKSYHHFQKLIAPSNKY